jgi:tetratricopeptide (TPR) repeat protein
MSPQIYLPALALLRFLVRDLFPNIVGEVTGEATIRHIDQKLQQLKIGNRDLALALRQAYVHAVGAISAGLRQRYGGFEAKAIREFAKRLDYDYFQPFSEERRLGIEVQTRLRQDSKAYCRILIQQADHVLRLSDIERATIQRLLIPISEVRGVAGLEELIEKTRMGLLSRVRSLDGVEDLFCDFLVHNELLMDAIVYFFEAAIKADPRAAAILTHYDLQTLRIEVAKLRSEQQPEVAKVLEVLEARSVTLNQAFGDLQQITIEGFDQILSEIEEVHVGIDEINKQIHYLEKAIWVAMRARDFEEVAELGRALVELEERHRRKSGAQEHREAGVEYYKKGLAALKAGKREQAMQEFRAAEKSFRGAVDIALKTDENMPIYLTDLGNSLTMQGQLAGAIPFYERALRLSKNYEAAARELHKRMLEMSQRQINDKQYIAAIDSLEYALVLNPDDEPTKHWLAHALNEEANAKLGPDATKNDQDRSRALMMKAIFHNPTKDIYQSNLRTMQGGENRPKVIFLPEGQTDSVSVAESLTNNAAPCFLVWHSVDLPKTLCYWLDLFLPEFRELISEPPNKLRPIHIWWLGEGPETKARLESIDIPDRTSVGVAMSHFHNKEHYIMLDANYYSQVADPVALIGDLSHELAHEAFKELGVSSRLPDWTASDITEAANERITDLLVIYKGLGPFLLRSRRYMEQKNRGWEGDYPSLIPVEIRRYLRREAEQEAKRRITTGAKLKNQGADEEATAYFRTALRTWKWIVEEDSSYAFAWYELSIAHDWLGDKDEAMRAAQRAVILDSNSVYRRWLDNLRMSKEEEARQLVNNGAELEKIGKSKPARRLFRRAEAIWREFLREYFEVARVHFELGITLEWQKRIPEALYEFRIAAALDPRNDKYAAYLQAVLERYGEQ